MAHRIRRLGVVANPAANTRTRLYTVPAGKAALLRTVSFGGATGSASLMGITINGFGFVWQPPVPASGSLIVPLGTYLTAGDYVDAENTTTDGYTLLQGVEFDTPPPSLARPVVVTVTSGAVYTVPAGKRLRVRDVTLCPHNGTGIKVDVTINGVGYLFRGDVPPAGLVIGHDMTVNAGEVISAQRNQGTVNLFITGLLEDA